MSDVIERIRLAQIQAAEKVVIDDLHRKEAASDRQLAIERELEGLSDCDARADELLSE